MGSGGLKVCKGRNADKAAGRTAFTPRRFLPLTYRIVGVAILALIAGCLSYETVPYSEATDRNWRVVDKGTGLGIPNAYVVLEWRRIARTLADATSSCERLELIRSEGDGHLVMPLWQGRIPRIARVYKPEYARASDDHSLRHRILSLTRSAHTSAERAVELRTFDFTCGNDEDRKLLNYFSALYDEVVALKPPDAYSRLAETFLLRSEEIQYGRDEAFRRFEQRQRATRGGTQ